MRRALAAGVVVALALAGFLVLRGGEDPYVVKLRLANAGGLSDGSPVVIGGVAIGKVKLDADQRGVDVELDIDRKHAPIGRDASASIIAQNVLGQKQVSIDPGDRSKPAPEGTTLPARNVRQATDLDQLLSTLDADTRTRLAIVINETGTAFARRKMDFRTFMTEAAPGLSAGADLLGQLTQDNRALTNLLTTSDSYVGTLVQWRRRLSRMLERFGQTTETVVDERENLRKTLRGAPAALASTRTFLAELRRTTVPLRSTARRLTATAPALQTALSRIEPFRVAAEPSLETATAAAPALNGLKPSTPVFQRLQPALDSLQTLSLKELPPVGATLDKSTDNLLATVENWSRAIQVSDGLGHIFRGEAGFSPQLYERLIKFLKAKLDEKLGPSAKDDKRPAPTAPRGKRPSAPRPGGAPQPAPSGGPAPATPGPTPAKPVLPEAVTGPVKDILEKVPLLGGQQPKSDPGAAGSDQGADQLLDYLLGP